MTRECKIQYLIKPLTINKIFIWSYSSRFFIKHARPCHNRPHARLIEYHSIPKEKQKNLFQNETYLNA